MKLRLLKLFVLFGLPLLGFIYAYQFTGQDREIIVPFRPFLAPNSPVSQGGVESQKVAIPFTAPITIVNFWATWCPPCVEEFPAMIEMRRQLQDKGVKLVFVSVDDDWQKVEKFLSVNNIAFDPETMFWDSKKETATLWGSTKFPETYVVRRDSWVVEKIIGAQAWTRPIVIKYFSELGEKFKNLSIQSWNDSASRSDLALATLSRTFISRAFAQDAPAIHEQDQKTLDKLKKNIEIATQNLQNAEAAEKEEERNLQEEKITLERREKDLSDARDDLEKIQAKTKEVNALLSKTLDSMKLEEREKARVEKQIKEIQERIVELQKRLDQNKDELNQANKGLNTRVQAIETFEKAKLSSTDEIDQLKVKQDKAKELVDTRIKEKDLVNKGISARQKKLAEIKSQKAKAKKVLDEQKAKLAEFEKVLKK